MTLNPADLFGKAGGTRGPSHRVPADASGVDAVAHYLLTAERSASDDAAGPLVVLGADIPGRLAQSLLFALGRAGVEARLVLISVCNGGPGAVLGRGDVVALACLAWGTRVVQRA